MPVVEDARRSIHPSMRGHQLLEPCSAPLAEDEKQLFPAGGRSWRLGAGEYPGRRIEHLKTRQGEALLDLTHAARGIVGQRNTGSPYSPNIEVIAGSETSTVHKENIANSALDASRVMFCGQLAERLE